MRLPIIPIVVAAVLLAGVFYLFNASRSGLRTLDVPRMTRLVDVTGVETEVSIAPDGNRCAVVASGDLWLVNLSNGESKRLTQTPEPESFPNWTPDAKRITFTRGADTFAITADSGAEELFRKNATWLSWSSTSRTTFVRERALWTANPNDQNEKKLVDADMIPDIDIQTPRFSPDALQIAFIKTQLGLRGEVWMVDAVDTPNGTANGQARPLVSDRPAENPVDVGWINGGQDIAYLTNRAGAFSVWYIDLVQATINPLTQPLVTMPLARIGMAVTKDRIVLPRHFVDSNIVLSDGTAVASTVKIEFQPAVSPNGELVAYTIADENRQEIWTAGIKGDSPTFRTLGREPRFSANGFQIVYTHTDLTGNDDIWKLDIRNGSAEHVTDADEIDVTADWSSDGRSIAFASARGGAISIWTIPGSGGKRLRVNDAGYAPRYSPDTKSILFWNRQALWMMDADGANPHEVAKDLFEPAAGVWAPKGKEFFAKPQFFAKPSGPAGERPAWPGFDVLPDGRFVTAPIDIRETALWAIDLTYKEK